MSIVNDLKAHVRSSIGANSDYLTINNLRDSFKCCYQIVDVDRLSNHLVNGTQPMADAINLPFDGPSILYQPRPQ